MFIHNSEKLIQTATKKVNLTDFGDKRYSIGLNALVEAVGHDYRISLIGRLVIQGIILEYLKNRLLIRESITTNPSMLDSKIQQPIFIVGLSRTGTTLLHNLLALAPDACAPKTWEFFYPVPPVLPNSQQEKIRINRVKRKLRMLHIAAPRLRIIHPIKATAVEECYPLINHTFISPAFVLHYGIPKYLNWLKKLDFDTACWVYNEYKSQLQILQVNHPNSRWVLKSAVHLYFLDALWNEFPDALIIKTHRDPLKMVPSLCSMVQCFRKIIYKKVIAEELGPECLKLLCNVITQGIKARKRHPAKKIIDIYFDELIIDPIGQVRKIHDYFNLGWDHIHERRMKQWLIMNPHGKNGIHHYSLSQYGLNEERVMSLQLI